MENLCLDLPLIPSDLADCPRCLARLQEALHAHKGVSEVHIQDGAASPRLSLRYDPLLITAQRIEEEARRAGLDIAGRYGHLRLPIEGLDCADCARTLEEGVRRLPGVQHAAVALLAGTLDVEYEQGVISRREIEARVHELGYRVASREATWVYRVEGMDCADCAARVEQGLAGLEGVLAVELSFATGRMAVRAQEDPALRREIESRLRGLGYQARLETGAARTARPQGGLLSFIRRNRSAWWAAAALPFALSGLIAPLLGLPAWLSNAALAAALLLAGLPVARAGWAALRATRSPDMNVLMTLAGLGALAIGEWAEGAMALFLFAIGELLERYSMDRARGAIRALVDLSPQEAARLVEGGEEHVGVEALQPGDHIRVRPGERIAADGEVLEGHSAVDQAAITGESLPVDRGPGDSVYAGTLNGEGLLIVEVRRPASDSTLARIIAMVEEAQGRKAPVQRFVDRFARYYTPAVVLGALLIAVVPPLFAGTPLSAGFNAAFVDWFYRALVLLVIACPCALVLSTPVSIASGIAAAARLGVLIKGGAYLEALGRLRALALDKTGTLTEGRPAVASILAYSGHSEGEVLQAAAAVESGSTHPLARAIVHEARRRGLAMLPAEDAQALTGRGAAATVAGRRVYLGNHTFFEAWGGHPASTCQEVSAIEAAGQTVVLVGTEREVWGAIAVADWLRPEARQAVEALRRAGVGHVVLLTGDNRATAEAMAGQVGVDDVRANLLPGQKVDAVEALLARFGHVGMVGDGVNDAPALARATVGIAMGAMASDAALETADVALMTDDLTRLPLALHLGQQARRVIAQNIAIALGLKALFLGLAVAGLATLWMAVFADVGASLIVTLNGMRLLLNKR